MFDKFRDRREHAAELRVSNPQQKGDMIVRYLSVDSEYLSRDRTSPDQRLKTISSKALYFLHHFASVCLHRDLAYAKFPTDLFIQQTGNHQRHNLPLTMGE